MSRGGDPLIRQSAERLADLLTAELHPQQATEKVISILQELQSPTQEQVINYPLQRHNQRTAVHLAAGKGLWQCLEVLLKNGGDPNVLSSLRDWSQTPLHIAAQEGNGKCIEVLLENGAKYQVENVKKETALHLASDQFCQMKIKTMIARLEVPKERTRSDESVVKKLHQLVQDGENHSFFQLYMNHSKEKVDLGTRWNDKHIDPDSTETLLYRACASEAEDVVKFILSRSESQPLSNLQTGDSPVHVASEKGKTEIVRQLLQHSPKLLLERNSTEKSALHFASMNGHHDVVAVIFEYVCQLVKGLHHMYNKDNAFSLDFPDSNEVTPFYLACLHGHAGIVRQFLDLKKDLGNLVSLTVNSTQKDGHTTLHAAAYSGKSEAVEVLLDSEEVNANALAPPILETKRILWQAIGGSQSKDIPRANQKIVVSATGEFIADIDGSMKGNQPLCLTPLAEACVHKHAKVVEVFLKYGARDEDGLACRVLATIREFDLSQKVLAYHCKATKKKVEGDKEPSPEDVWSLELLWDGKKLPFMKKEWLGINAVFYPTIQGDEFEDASDRRQGQCSRGYSTGSLRLPSRFDSCFIRNVTLKSNRLRAVPLELFQLKNVTSIDLSDNLLSALPVDAWKERQGVYSWECRKLEEFKVSDNMLTEFPMALWVLPELKRLKAKSNSLTKLVSIQPVLTSTLAKSLTKIDISDNKLTDIDFITEFPSLREVDICHNRLTTLPLALWGLHTLHDLKASHNYIESLASPAEVETIQEEQPEEAEANQAVRGAARVTAPQALFMPQVSHHPSLDPQQSIDGALLSGGIDQLRYSVGGRPESCVVGNECSNLKKLDLSDNYFEEFPQDLPCLAPTLVELTISNNTFKEVELRFLPPNLKKLYIKDCQIERFGSVKNKEQLQVIAQSCVRKEFVDEPCRHRSHAKLADLRSLNLKQNRLTHFQVLYHKPPSKGAPTPNFGAEENVYEKQVAVNDLLYPSLENLDLSHNRLEGVFNPNVAHLTMIKAIQLNDNEPLQKIPYELGHLKKLKGFTELNIKNLPDLVQPPKDIEGHTCQQLLAYLAASLKDSDVYRTIKLFLVGRMGRGKSTLLRKLCPTGQTEGSAIDLGRFTYAPVRQTSVRETLTHLGRSRQVQKKPAKFLVWDFAGQDRYHSTHHCFYSRRSLYLVVFQLTDGEEGVRELDTWLRNIQLRARGCPAIIVGTHTDKVDRPKIAQLEDLAKKLYMNPDTAKCYPQVVNVVSISCVRDNVDRLKRTLYDVATHLQLGRDGQSLKHVPDMQENDPKALFQQQVPKSFVTLQEKCDEYAKKCKGWAELGKQQLHNGGEHVDDEGSVPVMNEEEFRNHFGGLFDGDKEELDEAVAFLHLQGTLLHFDDHNLRELYFLDPQWLAQLMAEVIRPQAIQGQSPVDNGVVQVSHLFRDHAFNKSLKRKYIQLLEKFEVALKISPTQVLIPTLMPENVIYPRTNDDLRDIHQVSDEYLQPPLRRFWLADYIPEGFWPRLICRIANDQQIEKIMRKLIGEDGEATPRASPEADEEPERESMLDWKPWKMGVAFSHRGRTLLIVKEECNVAPDGSEELEWLPAKRRIEIHVYVQEWFEVQNELQLAGHSATMLQNTFSLPGIATQLLAKISQHILSLAHNWFRGMLENELIYIPCWKCYSQMKPSEQQKCGEVCKRQSRYFPVRRRDEMFGVFAFNHEKCIIIAALNKDLECPIHGPIKVVHTAPDLIFWDLASLSAYEQDMSSPLVINDKESLGRGGYGFVCKGELILGHEKRKKVAVKGFLAAESADGQYSVSELLEISKKPENLYHAYKEIRQEVSFLAVLDHNHLTKLCGVRTSPYMCLLLELAPHGSLEGILQVYKKYEAVLEPVTLKASIYQIASGLGYLHMQQIVHRDMKSGNVLVWHFPSGRLSREKRVERAGHVWLKLADYGTSEVFTKPMMKLSASPVGTPGYMAPELFGNVGQEISTEKVDVFAFGMVVYELLCLHPPFYNVMLQMRDNLIKENKRPPVQGGGVWSPLMAQNIMQMCWEHDPDNRPTMKEVTQCVQQEEFIRLRSAMSLEKVESVSCACVCRIVPDEDLEPPTTNGHDASGIGHIQVENSITSAVFDLTGSALLSDMDPCMQYTQLQFEPPSFSAARNILPPIIDKRGTIYSDGSFEMYESKLKERNHYAKQLSQQTYSQLWVCDRQQRGLLEVFTYCDSQAGYYAFASGNSDQITTICPVRTMMWIGTAKGILKLKHIPTLSTSFKGELKTDGKSIDETYVLAITYVEKASSVLVSTNASEIWAFSDMLTPEGLVIEERIRLQPELNCYQLIVVEVRGSLEVWGTMDNSQLILFQKHGKGWMMGGPYKVKCRQNWQFYHIAHAAFEDQKGDTHNHLWVPYWKKGSIVCWDLQKRQHRTTLDTSALKSCAERDNIHPKVTALVASGKNVLVGTDFGTVGIIDSETCDVLHCLKWHNTKVRTLLLMPKEMEPCVCSELPLAESNQQNSVTRLLNRPSTRKLLRQRTVSDSSLPDSSENVPNSELEKYTCMVASIGNGRAGIVETNLSKKDDVCMLLWRC